MNYKYHNDGTNTIYTVNGVEYTRLEDVPQEHQNHFINLDKNKNGIPDSIEPLWDAVNNSGGSFTNVIGALFKTVKSDITSVDTIQTADFEEVKEVKEKSADSIKKERYDQHGMNVMQKGESSFIPTLIKVLVAGLVLLTIAWYFGLIK